MTSSDMQARRKHAAAALSRYWPGNEETILHLPFVKSDANARELPPRLAEVELPPWGSGAGVEGRLLVPAALVAAGGPEQPWERTDWLAAAFWFLNGEAEREHEVSKRPIHSYSGWLKQWDARMWDHAWANRIALFLRRAVAQLQKCDETFRLGPLPKPEIRLTHDLDAVRKTSAIRFKQSAFNLFNAARALRAGKWSGGARHIGKAFRLLLGTGSDYDGVARVIELERARQFRASFNIYAGWASEERGFRRWLFDPAYSLEELASQLTLIEGSGCTIGLHGSFDSWADSLRLSEERERLAAATGRAITECRQHWLRFSWNDTWAAQARAGLRLDSTLGFNDRPGFRNGAAVRFKPWQDGKPLQIEALPLVLMDSHLYDYAPIELSDEQRAESMRHWIDEIIAVGGEAAVLWHPHTLSGDYGWSRGFEDLLALLP